MRKKWRGLVTAALGILSFMFSFVDKSEWEWEIHFTVSKISVAIVLFLLMMLGAILVYEHIQRINERKTYMPPKIIRYQEINGEKYVFITPCITLGLGSKISIYYTDVDDNNEKKLYASAEVTNAVPNENDEIEVHIITSELGEHSNAQHTLNKYDYNKHRRRFLIVMGWSVYSRIYDENKS